MKTNHVLLFLLCNWLFQNVYGQVYSNSLHDLKFKQLSSREGLSQRSVIDILQDKKGYLWFGTRDGLNKYDGDKFVVYRHISENENSLSHSWVTSVFEDNYGNLWVGTKDGLNKYNPETDNFTRYKQTSIGTSISDNEIWDLTQLNDNALYVATNSGIDKLDIIEDKISHFKIQVEGTFNSGDHKKTRNFLVSRSGDLWVCTVEGIDVYNLKNNNVTHYNYPKGTTKDIHINNAPTLFEDSHHTIWLGYEMGLAIFDRTSNTFIDYKFNKTKGITSAVRTICEDYSGNLWIGTYTGIYILNSEKQTITHIVHDENNPKSLSQNSVYKIFLDSRADIWIGTWAGGVNFYDKSFDTFKLFSAGDNNTMLNYKVVSAIVEDPNKNLWIGTEGGGINFYDRKTNKFTYYTHDPDNYDSLSSNNVKAIIQDRSGNLWIGTHDKGLNFLNPNKKPLKFEHFESVQLDGIAISDYRILSLLEDHNQNIWIGTLTDGLFFYDTQTKVFYKLDDNIKSVACIVQTSDPNYILAGGSQGLESVNVNTKKRAEIPFKKNAKSELASKSVNCVFIDDQNNYWIGTEGSGLYFYNPDTGKSIKYGTAQGLPNEVVYGILSDDNGYLWISNNQGISRLSVKTNQIKNFDEFDGLQGNEFNYGAFLKTSKGELMFGGTNGLNYFDPNKINENTFIPKVDIYNLNVNNKPYLKITDSISKITLKYNQNDFSIDFIGLSYSQANKNQYAYKLEGFDADWNYIGNNKTATYTNIDAGDYVFKVKASNNDGVWNEKGDSVEISVFPAPWKTWWAYLIYSLIVAVIVYYIRMLTLARIKVKNELKQERIDKERIEEINKLKLQLFTNISHDFRTPLTLIVGPLQRMIEKKKGDNEIQGQLKSMYRNAITLLQLINQLLDFRKSEAGKLELHASKNNIVPFLQNVKLSFEELAKERHINYSFKTNAEDIEVWFDEIELKKVIVNILSNAFKFTPDHGSITLSVSISKDMLNENNSDCVKLVIEDNGKGIPEKEIEFIFDRFFQLGEPDKKRSGTGVGLSLAKDIVELHHGTIKVESTEGKGVAFIVLLPLGNTHLQPNEMVNDNDLVHPMCLEPYEPTFLKSGWVQKESDFHEDIYKEELPSILLVEDNIEVRKFIKDIFKKDFNIFEAKNGKKGIEIAQSNPIDLIISDVMMPVMDGIEMCNVLKSDIKTSHIPIILLTAKTSSKAQETGFKTGADIYITKPFDANILELQVNNLFSSRKHMILKYKKDVILTPKELTVTPADEEFLERAFHIVEENISSTGFNAQSFTDEIGMSRTLLYTKLKALTGQSLSEFIRTVRLKKAAQMIAQTEMNISEIAYEVGFSDLKYFRKSFKVLFNASPTEYRSKAKQSESI
ncbi:hybrid sensor histidine kinase/response regulator transcription factor [Aestuariivivens insulae]|uniref:hybrid sensor histidine kinase/response regulator transcription factor n=1 Tax=Aestuariivivens insulae TaxID=1621988 RepID=UPI001F5767F0|nr:two-component regulator propeller domain-containing protein [Aestuariivivens insulae]